MMNYGESHLCVDSNHSQAEAEWVFKILTLTPQDSCEPGLGERMP